MLRHLMPHESWMSLLSESVGHSDPRFRGKGSSLGNIFWFLQN